MANVQRREENVRGGGSSGATGDAVRAAARALAVTNYPSDAQNGSLRIHAQTVSEWRQITPACALPRVLLYISGASHEVCKKKLWQ